MDDDEENVRNLLQYDALTLTMKKGHHVLLHLLTFVPDEIQYTKDSNNSEYSRAFQPELIIKLGNTD